MKITKYPQSCFLIETQGKRILIDPGDLEFNQKWLDEDWKDIDIILVTHRHSDHCFVEIINRITNRDKIKIYTSREVVEAYSDLENYEVVKENDVLNFDNLNIEVVKAVHGFISYFKGGKEIKENIGYIIDDNQNRVYHVSDSVCFDNNYKCDVILLPISNHGVVMGPWEASDYAKEYEPKLVLPMHADHPRHPVNFNEVKKELNDRELNYKFLEFGESIEV